MIRKIKNLSSAVVFITIMVFSPGCATWMNGTQQYLGIVSDPPGAKVTVDNRIIYDTPVTVVLEKRENHTVKIELEGYFPYEIKISKKVNWLLAGVGLYPLFPSIIIDFITGGIYTLSPEQVKAQLKQEDIGLIGQGDRLYISVVLEPPADMERIATLTKRTQLTK